MWKELVCIRRFSLQTLDQAQFLKDVRIFTRPRWDRAGIQSSTWCQETLEAVNNFTIQFFMPSITTWNKRFTVKFCHLYRISSEHRSVSHPASNTALTAQTQICWICHLMCSPCLRGNYSARRPQWLGKVRKENTSEREKYVYFPKVLFTINIPEMVKLPIWNFKEWNFVNYLKMKGDLKSSRGSFAFPAVEWERRGRWYFSTHRSCILLK